MAEDIAALTAAAGAADADDAVEPQALSAEITGREVLKAKLDEACAHLEAEALPGYEKNVTPGKVAIAVAATPSRPMTRRHRIVKATSPTRTAS